MLMVGSASHAFSMNVKSLSSSERFSASMAMRYWELGNANAAASTLPVTDRVSPVSALSLGTTMMSPA